MSFIRPCEPLESIFMHQLSSLDDQSIFGDQAAGGETFSWSLPKRYHRLQLVLWLDDVSRIVLSAHVVKEQVSMCYSFVLFELSVSCARWLNLDCLLTFLLQSMKSYSK